VLRGELWAIVLEEAARGYPEEVCGVLVGREVRAASDDGHGAGVRVVERVVPVTNVRQDQRERRYVIDAPTVRRVEREAEADGLAVIGFYHTHPDHPAVPSEFDREHSWPWYTYIIVSVRDGEAADARAWRLLADRTGFEEETIEDGSEAEA
jgi:proteasome lid subunit RPN8/RPN11